MSWKKWMISVKLHAIKATVIDQVQFSCSLCIIGSCEAKKKKNEKREWQSWVGIGFSFMFQWGLVGARNHTFICGGMTPRRERGPLLSELTWDRREVAGERKLCRPAALPLDHKSETEPAHVKSLSPAWTLTSFSPLPPSAPSAAYVTQGREYGSGLKNSKGSQKQWQASRIPSKIHFIYKFAH